MSWDDFPTWFRSRVRRSPFFSRWFLQDFDEMFKEMEEMLEKEFKDITESVPKEMVREKRLDDGTVEKQWGPFVYGYSVTIGPDGKPKISEFGNVRPGSKAGRPVLNFRDKREPLVDVIDTGKEIRIAAELPGVTKEDIKLTATEQLVTISVDTAERQYHKEVSLPAEVDVNTAKSSYKNGILEIILKKREEETRKGRPIGIE